MVVDGEIQPDFAMNSDHLSDYPFSKLGETPANCFVFLIWNLLIFHIKSSEE